MTYFLKYRVFNKEVKKRKKKKGLKLNNNYNILTNNDNKENNQYLNVLNDSLSQYIISKLINKSY
jgi:hypothetical protein